MKINKPKVNFFEVVENIAMVGGFVCIVLLILINLIR